MTKITRLLVILLCVIEVLIAVFVGAMLYGNSNEIAGTVIVLLVPPLVFLGYRIFSAIFNGLADLKAIAEFLPTATASLDRSTETINTAILGMQADVRQLMTPVVDSASMLADVQQSIERVTHTIGEAWSDVQADMRQIVTPVTTTVSMIADLRQSIDRSSHVIDTTLPDFQTSLREIPPKMSESLDELHALRQSLDRNISGMATNLGRIAASFPMIAISSTRSYIGIGSGPSMNQKSLVEDILDIAEGNSAKPASRSAKTVVQSIVDTTHRT